MAVQPIPENEQQRGIIDDTVTDSGNNEAMLPLCPMLSTSEVQVSCVETGCAWFNHMVGACWIPDAALALKKIVKLL